MLRSSLMLVAAVAVVFGAVAPAAAVKPFLDEFVDMYADGTDETFTELVKKEAKCWVCHQGKKKGNRNPYGEALGELLSKKDSKNKEKIVAALEKVADEKSNPDDPDSPTFGELIEEGKLPGGDLETVKAEPAE